MILEPEQIQHEVSLLIKSAKRELNLVIPDLKVNDHFMKLIKDKDPNVNINIIAIFEKLTLSSQLTNANIFDHHDGYIMGYLYQNEDTFIFTNMNLKPYNTRYFAVKYIGAEKDFLDGCDQIRSIKEKSNLVKLADKDKQDLSRKEEINIFSWLRTFNNSKITQCLDVNHMIATCVSKRGYLFDNDKTPFKVDWTKLPFDWENLSEREKEENMEKLGGKIVFICISLDVNGQPILDVNGQPIIVIPDSFKFENYMKSDRWLYADVKNKRLHINDYVAILPKCVRDICEDDKGGLYFCCE